MQGNQNGLGNKGNRTLKTPQVPSPDGSPCIREQCQRELAGRWQPNQNGPGFACYSCYNNFGAGRKAKAAADPKQRAITQFFKKQKQ
jgi:hypothetical protein